MSSPRSAKDRFGPHRGSFVARRPCPRLPAAGAAVILFGFVGENMFPEFTLAAEYALGSYESYATHLIQNLPRE